MQGVERKKVDPYEFSVAELPEKVMDEKERVIGLDSSRRERSRYIPPPRWAVQEEKEASVTEIVLAGIPST